MADTRTGYVNGSDITVFINTGTSDKPKYEHTLGAKSHKCSTKAATKTIVDKDLGNPKFEKKSVKSLSISISVDGLVKLQTTGLTSDKLEELMMAGKEVMLRYGYKTAKTGDTYVQGMFIIESLDITSTAQEEATYSATFANSGEVKRVTATTS